MQPRPRRGGRTGTDGRGRARRGTRSRTERLLATGEQGQPGHLLASGAKLHLDPGLALLVVGLGQAQASLSAREQRGRDLREVLLHVGERLGEALLDGTREVVPKRLELGEALLEIGALRRELDEPLLLLVVLLLRQRVDLPERLAAALEPLDPIRQVLAVVTLRGVGGSGLEPAPRLVGLGVDPRPLDV